MTAARFTIGGLRGVDFGDAGAVAISAALPNVRIEAQVHVWCRAGPGFRVNALPASQRTPFANIVLVAKLG